MLVVNLHRRERGRQRAGRHDVFDAQRLLGGIEIFEVAQLNFHSPDAQPRAIGALQLEIRQLRQCFSQRRGVIMADRRLSSLRLEYGWREARREEAGNAESGGQIGARIVEIRPQIVFEDWKRALQP